MSSRFSHFMAEHRAPIGPRGGPILTDPRATAELATDIDNT